MPQKRIIPVLDNLTVFPGENFAGRTDADKVHLHLELTFNSEAEVVTWLELNQIPTTQLEQSRPDGHVPE